MTIETELKMKKEKNISDQALKGVKVIEYCSTLSGSYCTKLMADFGAEVIKIEQPETGDKARLMPPFPDDVPHREKSGLFLFLNTNKKGITLNPETPQGKLIFMDLIKEADVLIEDRPLGDMERLDLSYEKLKKANPGLIMTSITPFGRSGPFKDYKAYPLNLAHVSGQGYLLPLVSPHGERPPVKPGGHSSEYDPAMVVLVAVLAAVFRKGISGEGQFIELSNQEALISMQRVESVTYANHKIVMTRTGGKNRMPGGVLPCKDGHVVIITPQEHQWQYLVELLGSPEWAKGPLCRDRVARSENAEAINQHIKEWTMKYTKEEIYKKGQALSCPVSPCKTSKDLLESEQLAARGLFVELEHPILGQHKFPTSPYQFSESPWEFRYSAPLLGEHNEDVYCNDLGFDKKDLQIWKKEGVI